MKITLEGEPKEIAALVLAVQERQVESEGLRELVIQIIRDELLGDDIYSSNV